MSDDVRESIAANLDSRAAEFERISGDPDAPLGLWHQAWRTAHWLRELADEVRAGVL